jgi:hypothetical protein
MHHDLQPNETEIRGAWLDTGGKVVADAACERIEWLVKLRLERLGSDATGWETLYRDPSGGRLWSTRIRTANTLVAALQCCGVPPRLTQNRSMAFRCSCLKRKCSSCNKSACSIASIEAATAHGARLLH